MKSEKSEIDTHEIFFKFRDASGEALQRWGNLIWALDPSVSYVFAVMAGLAAPLMGLVCDEPVVINFYGGTAIDRRRIVQLAASCWLEPSEMSETLSNVSILVEQTELGFAYAFDAGACHIEDIKKAATEGATRMAIVCGECPLDECGYADDSIGGIKVTVLNLDVGKLRVRQYPHKQAMLVEARLAKLWKSYAGAFLLQHMREHAPHIEDIRSWILDQAGYEYEDDLGIIEESLSEGGTTIFGYAPLHVRDQFRRLLSIIKAIAVIANDEGVLPDIQRFAVFSDIYYHLALTSVHATQKAMKQAAR